MRSRKGDIMGEGCCGEENCGEISNITNLLDKQIEAGKTIGSDLGTIAVSQAIQNMNLLTQDLMRKSMGMSQGASGVSKEDIRDIVKEIVTTIMKELGAEVK